MKSVCFLILVHLLSAQVATAEDLVVVKGSELARADGPVLWFGNPIQPDQPGVHRLIRAEKAFPTLKSCLREDAAIESGLDTAAFAWRSFSETADIQICVFRIAAALGDPGLFLDWVVLQGGKPDGPYTKSSSVMRHYGVVGEGVHVNGGWAADAFPFSRWRFGSGTFLSHSNSLSATFGPNGEALSSSALFNYE